MLEYLRRSNGSNCPCRSRARIVRHQVEMVDVRETLCRLDKKERIFWFRRCRNISQSFTDPFSVRLQFSSLVIRTLVCGVHAFHESQALYTSHGPAYFLGHQALASIYSPGSFGSVRQRVGTNLQYQAPASIASSGQCRAGPENDSSRAQEAVEFFASERRTVLLDSMVVILHGLSRNTKDYDIWLDPLPDVQAWQRRFHVGTCMWSSSAGQDALRGHDTPHQKIGIEDWFRDG
jgi:hypothetical protein